MTVVTTAKGNLVYADFISGDDATVYANYLDEIDRIEAELKSGAVKKDTVCLIYHPSVRNAFVREFDSDYGIMGQMLAFSLIERTHQAYTEDSIILLVERHVVEDLTQGRLDALVAILHEEVG